ncbi:hypothetical protein B0T24DRAFT_589196 [Lasiosphaeria ovina]|uniref:Uncharacterized protein n=1 Tax=Lasiosphaeria ovina TaxID=92902 RepID=A0AAE0NNL7_9PEZI|nr:hypothetical protein B0T24DRAFT_589196 [Lasiosphaeria ovina]
MGHLRRADWGIHLWGGAAGAGGLQIYSSMPAPWAGCVTRATAACCILATARCPSVTVTGGAVKKQEIRHFRALGFPRVLVQCSMHERLVDAFEQQPRDVSGTL